MGHGDSTIIKYDGPEGVSFGVIDSNTVGPGRPPALTKLLQHNAEKLSFVALTHPHADHFRGLLDVLTHYQGKVGAFFSFPLHSHAIGRVHKLAKMYKDYLKNVDSPTIRSAALELIKILQKAKNEFKDDWFEPVGMRDLIAPPGFKGVEISTLLPLPKERGWFFKAIDAGSLDILRPTHKENSISLAFQFKYAGQEVIIGGDGTYINWVAHKRQYERGGYELNSSVVRLPHHGARDDCQAPVLDHLFANEGQRYACISANGHSHPHADTYKALEARGIAPYCTNLAEQCGATLRELIRAPDLSPVLERFINTTADQPTERSIQPCQGDITIQITDAGAITVTPQYSHPCPYRGGYDFLDQLAAPGQTLH